MVGERVRALRRNPLHRVAHRCVGCGYGIVVSGVVPTCPMCGGSEWEVERMPAHVIERPDELVVEAENRWDAVDLTRRLPACRWFMVERDPRRWEVHVRLERAPRRLSSAVVGVVEEWAALRLHENPRAPVA